VAGFLLDTNVLSELRKRKPSYAVEAWFDTVNDDDLYLSVLVAGEIQNGIHRLRRHHPERAADYEEWLDELLVAYRDRIVGIDIVVAREWGRLSAQRPLPVVDGLLAATARVHKCTLVTRNVRDFPADLAILNPFEPPE
jgi:toxin FitB